MALTSWETFRARPCAIDGGHVRIELVLDEDFVSLDASEAMTRKLREHLHEEVEVEARVQRAWDGTLLGGEITAVTPLTRGNAVEAWRTWFRENASAWNAVDDIEAELDRHDLAEG